MSAGRRTTETVADREKAMESAVLTEGSTPHELAQNCTAGTFIGAMLSIFSLLKFSSRFV